jgi:peptidoglycan/LPS O-acetylase OafA/YrhL
MAATFAPTPMTLTQIAPAKSKLRYIPELDGLRGVAILMVMGVHGMIPFMKGGFIGVDIFFVLSGFLITTILIQEYNLHNSIDLGKFYLKRFLRLMPALLLLLVTVSIAGFFLLNSDLARANLKSALISLFYLSNFEKIADLYSSVFLGHTWSLAIEEQFYILWSLLLVLLLRFVKSRKKIVYIVLSLAFLSWMLRVLYMQIGISRNRVYFGLDTRMDGLLLGSALGILLASELINEMRKRQIAQWLKLLTPFSFGLLIYIGVALNHRNPQTYYWVITLVEVLVAILILDVFISKHSFVRQLLSREPLTWIGKVSYGLYLWHFPIYMALIFFGLNTPLNMVYGTVVASLIAVLSYYLVEQRFLKIKAKLG